MAIRVNKLLREANIGMQTLSEMLDALGVSEPDINPNTKISDDVANLVLGLCYKDIDLLTLIEESARKNVSYDQQGTKYSLKILGKIDLDSINNPRGITTLNLTSETAFKRPFEGSFVHESPIYNDENKSFWIEELVLLSSLGKANRMVIGAFDTAKNVPLYSVLIGSNGVGKSSIMKEIVDFFIDLHACQNVNDPKLSSSNKTRLKGVKYYIDGVCCEVVRLERTYLAKADGEICALKSLRLPLVVACHFGAFDKFPVQKVNGSSQTKYDVPCYKYVGAHVNGNMISSSAIAFRLLFALNESMDERQRQNIRSILDFIGYDHLISLQYSFVMKSKKDGTARESIMQRVQKDREYCNYTPAEKNRKISHLYDFYKKKTSSTKTQHCYEIDMDTNSENSDIELQTIYKLKQYELVNSTNVVFHKQGSEITSDEMSSGEFAMLSTVLSISAAANDPHTLVLLDEPELSQHPNWQMTLIDNLDRALKNQVCHLLIATHSHMLVSDLPMNRSSVTQLEKDKEGNLNATSISECTYGWSAEEVLLKVFKTATDRNRYFGERISKLLEQMGNNTIKPKEVADELDELQEISVHLSDVDPMKAILKTIVEAYN